MKCRSRPHGAFNLTEAPAQDWVKIPRWREISSTFTLVLSRDQPQRRKKVPFCAPENSKRSHTWVFGDGRYDQVYTEGDPTVDNESASPVYTAMDGGIASNGGESSPDEDICAPASSSRPLVASSSGASCSAPLLSTVPSEPTMATQSETFSQFLFEVMIPLSKATSDLAAMRDALSNCLSGCQPPPCNR